MQGRKGLTHRGLPIDKLSGRSGGFVPEKTGDHGRKQQGF